jgi:hypothetical protein
MKRQNLDSSVGSSETKLLQFKPTIYFFLPNRLRGFPYCSMSAPK